VAQARASSTEQVITAATRVFLEKGFKGSTIDDIAQAAGISKPTVYQYAKSKQWLLDRIVELICRVITDANETVRKTDAPPSVRLMWTIRMTIEMAVAYRGSFRLSLSQGTELSRTAQDEFRLWARRNTMEFAELLAACRQEGSLQWEGDIMHAANLIQSMLNSTHRWFYPGERSVDELVREAIQLISGVLAEPDMSEWPMPEIPTLPWMAAA